MAFSTGLLRALLYPVLFEEKPVAGVDRAIQHAIATGKLGTPAEFLTAIDEALAGSVDLQKALGDTHGDAAIRQFLREVAQRVRAP